MLSITFGMENTGGMSTSSMVIVCYKWYKPRLSTEQHNDTDVSDLVTSITGQLSPLDANQADGTAANNPGVFTQQVRRKLAAYMDNDEVHDHPQDFWTEHPV
jgi:hypothetical protein